MRETCLNQTELAARWKISPRTRERWRWAGEGPQFLKVGGRVIYRIENVEAFERDALSASFHDIPCDGHILTPALEKVEILTDQRPNLTVVDRGYRGHGEARSPGLISGTHRGLTPKLNADLRRSAIEAEIGHMKTDGRLSRYSLKGTFGDALFALLCGCGHKIRKILAHLRALLALTIAAVMATLLEQTLLGKPSKQPDCVAQHALSKSS